MPSSEMGMNNYGSETMDHDEVNFSDDEEEVAAPIKTEELTDDDDDLPLSKVCFYSISFLIYIIDCPHDRSNFLQS